MTKNPKAITATRELARFHRTGRSFSPDALLVFNRNERSFSAEYASPLAEVVGAEFHPFRSWTVRTI